MKKYKLGYTTGVFDMFHIGHLNILCRAKEQCERLVVGVTTDALCFSRKEKYPIINEIERVAIVKAIRYITKIKVFDTWPAYKCDPHKTNALEKNEKNKNT